MLGNSDAVQMISDMRQATEHDLKGGSKLKSLLAARNKRGENESDVFDHVRDSVELAKAKLKKMIKDGKSDGNLTADLKHLCKQMEISVREFPSPMYKQPSYFYRFVKFNTPRKNWKSCKRCCVDMAR